MRIGWIPEHWDKKMNFNFWMASGHGFSSEAVINQDKVATLRMVQWMIWSSLVLMYSFFLYDDHLKSTYLYYVQQWIRYCYKAHLMMPQSTMALDESN
ncbi:predicted protein [Lichtheimia corymbifera JMRC:FSU:9682]|uniref:Uncharacterized protein n=1 Tax=Lichtheimia corymbifera JMRC:FSU:9682 TaxID=1263082 RepID=A0A068RYJ4_9FUNG|nr:predicted protein [Lichtheimia corymbifera JMRC:FSU:9682]